MRRLLLVALLGLAAPGCGQRVTSPQAAGLEARLGSIALGTGLVVVGGRTFPLQHVYHWVPFSFGDADGLTALLESGADPHPVEDPKISIWTKRHRTFPVSGWSDDADHAELALTVAGAEGGGSTAQLWFRAAGVACDATLKGDGYGRAWLDGRCGDGARVSVLYNAWALATAFQLSPANRKELGASVPDWRATREYCAARPPGRRAPLCGPDALLALRSEGGRQAREPLAGTWILTKTGGMLVHLSWLDHEELLIFLERPAPGWRLTANVLSFSFSGMPDSGRYLGHRTVALTYDFDGAVLRLTRDRTPERRVVPDQLVVTGVFGRVLGR